MARAAQTNGGEPGYIVTARKWRPMLFDDIVGQEHVATTLRNAVASNRLSHAYIFSGPRGVGKTTCARILAKVVNCLRPDGQNPDNSCELCEEITAGRSVNVFEIDGASNRGVEEIRNLRDAVRYPPARGKYKVYIIDEVHMLTKEAFNALLKTLEEPPPFVLFIFATTEIHKVPLTILSRCQRFDFRRIALTEIAEHLRHIAQKEKIAIDDDALLLVAKRGDGSMRDAQSIFDQVVSFCGDSITAPAIRAMLNIVDDGMFFRVGALIKAHDVKGGLLLVDEVVNGGFDIKEFLGGLTSHFRNMLVVVSTQSTALIDASEPVKARYEAEAKAFTETDLLRLMKIAAETDAALRYAPQPRLKLEIGLVQMIKLDASIEIGSLLEGLEELKKQAAGGAGPMRPGAPAAARREAAPMAAAPPAARPPVRTETPVRGSVKATPPTLQPHQIVPESARFTSSEAALPVVNLPRRDEPSLSAADVAGKWPALIEEARRERIAVGTMLSGTSIIDVRNNMLRIGCPDDFHLDGLRRNRQYLIEIAQRVYGAKLQLEAIVASAPAAEAHAENSPQPSAAPSGGRHPVIDAFIREFGAQEID